MRAARTAHRVPMPPLADERLDAASRWKPDPDTTLADYVTHWLPTMAGVLRPKTYANYELAFRVHVVPELGRVPLRELTRHDLRQLLLILEHRHGLAKTSARHVLTPVSSMLEDAVDDHLLPSNPAHKLRRRRRYANPDQHEERLADSMNERELARFASGVRKYAPAWLDFFHILSRTGLRLGEAMALQYDDCNPTACTLTVRRTRHPGRIGPTKTGRARVVDISRATVAIFERRRLDHPHDRWVFQSPMQDDLPYSKAAAHLVMKAVLRDARLPTRWTPKSLRHTYATLLIRHAPVEYVQQQLGHASVAVTIDVYCRDRKHHYAAAVAHLDRIGAPTVRRRRRSR